MNTSIKSTFLRSHGPYKSRSFFGRVGHFMALAHQRRQLAKLDTHMLNDIGVTRKDALSESAKAPWDVPQHWHH